LFEDKMTTTFQIEADRDTVYFDEEFGSWMATCPQCLKLVILDSRKPVCKCGLTWYLDIKAIGTK